MAQRSSVLGLALVLWAVGAAGTRLAVAEPTSGTPPLPEAIFTDHLCGVILIDTNRVDDPQLRATAKAILGPYTPVLDSALGHYQGFHQRLSQAGAVAWAFALQAEGEEVSALPLLALGPAGSDEAAASTLLTEALDEDPAAAVCEHLGVWRVAHSKDLALPATGLAERRQMFDTALAVGSGRPVRVVLLGSPAIQQELTGATARTLPPAVQTLLTQTLEARWLALAAEVGDKPALTITVQMKSADAATQLVAQVAAARQQVQDLLRLAQGPAAAGSTTAPANPGAQPGATGNLAACSALLDTLQPQQQGATVSLTLDAAALRALGEPVGAAMTVARAAATAVASRSNMRQLLLGLSVYAGEHQGKLPDKIEDIQEYVGGAEAMGRLMTNPHTGAAAGYIYLKPAPKMSAIADPAATPMIREARDGQPDPNGAVGYADGHVEPKPR
jgi:hypothetical protein